MTGECFDIGVTTAGALQSFRATGEPLSGSTDPDSAGNGSLMRLAPVAIRWWHEPAKAVEAARLQSRTTHGAAQTVEACALYAEVLTEAIAGAPKETVLRARERHGDAAIAEVAAGSWRAKDRDAISSSGYVLHTLRWSRKTGQEVKVCIPGHEEGQRDGDDTTSIHRGVQSQGGDGGVAR